MDDHDRETAGVIAPPPLIYGAALTLGLMLHRLRPLRLVPPRAGSMRRPLGLLLVGIGLLQALWGAFTLHRAGNNPDPSHPVVALVKDGPFRISRNPIYIALTSCYLGVSVLIGTMWHVLLLPALLTVMQRGVVRREEAYLLRRFGDDYRSYTEDVRRWL